MGTKWGQKEKNECQSTRKSSIKRLTTRTKRTSDCEVIVNGFANVLLINQKQAILRTCKGYRCTGLLKKKGFKGLKIEKSGKETRVNVKFKVDEPHRALVEKVYLLNTFLEHFGIVVTDRWNNRFNQMELHICIDEQTLCKMYEKSRSH